LSGLLLAHGAIMNGGVFHAVVDVLKPEQLTAACDGFRLLGFDNIAELLKLASTTMPNSADEKSFNARYGQSIPDDSVLVEHFERHFAEHPELYAPLEEKSGGPQAPDVAKNIKAMQSAALEWKRRR